METDGEMLMFVILVKGDPENNGFQGGNLGVSRRMGTKPETRSTITSDTLHRFV